MLADRGSFPGLQELAQRTVVEGFQHGVDAQRQNSSRQDSLPACASASTPGRFARRAGGPPLGSDAAAPAFARFRPPCLASLGTG